MLHVALLVTHVTAGAAGLLLGPLAMRQDVRRFAAGERTAGPANTCYAVAVLVVCLSATALVVEHRPELWWLVAVSALTFALAVLARVSAARRPPGWTHGYTHGIGGSFIALVTALVVVALTVDGPVTGAAQLIPWLAPTVVGTPLIELWRRHVVAALPVREGPGPMAELALRIGDAEREQLTAALGQHVALGHLSLAEFEDRIDHVYAARTRAELDAVVADLPSIAPPVPAAGRPRSAPWPAWGPWAAVSALCLAIWALTVLTTGTLHGFWPVWVIAPWGLAMLTGHRGRPARR